MGEEYGIQFNDEEKKRFGVISAFGVPMGNLKQYIMMEPDQRKASGLETLGLPMADTTERNELGRWIFHSRKAVAELHNQSMQISIKGDANEEYPAIKKVVDIFQKQDMNKFSLITSPKGGI